MNRMQLKCWALLSLTSLAIGCASDANEVSMPAPSIVGIYTDDYGQSNRITADAWTIETSVFHFVRVDNSESFAIAQNDSANQYSPSLWSRFDWAKDGEQNLLYCQTVYDAVSAEEAAQSTPADSSDFDAGCAGFAWSKLIPAP